MAKTLDTFSNLSISNLFDFKLVKSAFSANSDVPTSVAFLRQILLHNLLNLIQLLFYICYWWVVLENNSFFINPTVKRIIVAFTLDI